MTDEGSNGWREYQKLVLSELRRLDDNVERLSTRIDKAVSHERGNRQTVETATQNEVRRIALEVQSLKVRAGIWGLLGGLLPVLTALVLRQL